MNFSYENQGAITYLVCALEPTEQVDGLTLGMLTNNHIAGFAPVLYTEMNGQRYLKYNISAKVTADQFFAGSMNKQRAMTAFQNILGAICSADDYMIDMNCFVLDSAHVYLNVSSCETAIICVPVIGEKNANEEVAALFKKIMFTTQFDNSEDASYITHLLTYINSGADFTVYGLKDLVTKIQSGALIAPVAQPAPVAQQMPVQPAPVAPQPVPQPVATVSAFDSTISIDDMPAMMAQKQQAQQVTPVPQPQTAPAPQVAPQPQTAPAPQVAPQPQTTPAPQVAPQSQTAPAPQQAQVPTAPPVKQAPPQVQIPAAPSIKPVPQPQPHQQPAQQVGAPGSVRPIVNGAPPVQPNPAKPPQKPVSPKRPPAQNGPGFAIPGQPPMGGAGNVPVPPMPTAPTQKQSVKANDGGEKKMSFFGLLSHYSKENAELYKKQKEETNAKKTGAAGKAAKKPVTPPAPNMPGAVPNPNMPGAVPARQNGMGVPPTGVPAQPGAQPQYQQPIRPAPVPVQNSFNETTVLSPAMMGGGETTVLSAEPARPDPTLTRVKTGERISINKPVFRIGKEKSYVDYFIGDNTAISRSHANIHTENGEYFVEDTNSTNHTYVNGKLINSNVKVKITSGDKVRFANEDFTFSV